MFSGSPPKVVWEIWLEWKANSKQPKLLSSNLAKTSELKFCQISRYRSDGLPHLLRFNFCHKTFIFKVHGWEIFIKNFYSKSMDGRYLSRDFYREKEDCIEHGAPPKYFRLDLPSKGFNFRLNYLSHRCFKNTSNWWSLKKSQIISASNCLNKIQLFTTQILWISCIATLIKLDRKGSTSTWSEFSWRVACCISTSRMVMSFLEYFWVSWLTCRDFMK